MPDEKKRPKVVVKQPGREVRISRAGTVLASKKAPAKKAAAAKKAPAKKPAR